MSKTKTIMLMCISSLSMLIFVASHAYNRQNILQAPNVSLLPLAKNCIRLLVNIVPHESSISSVCFGVGVISNANVVTCIRIYMCMTTLYLVNLTT